VSAEDRPCGDVVPFGQDADGQPVILIIDETQRFGPSGGGKAADLEALMRRMVGKSVLLRVVDPKADAMILGPDAGGGAA
jgi:hypothetical protein